jgi:hypothetical protein
MFAIAIRYGAVAGSVVVGVIMLGLALGGGANGHGGIFATEWFGYTVMLVALSTIFLAIRDYRNQRLGGVIKFLPAFSLGLMIAAIAALAYTLAWEAYLAATHYAFMDAYAAAMQAHARAAGLTGAALKAKLDAIQQMRAAYANPLERLAMTFLEIFPVGLLIAVISAAILRNPKAAPARG